MDDTIINAENLYLHVPVFKPSERKLKVNFLSLIANVYGNKYTRDVKTLLSDVSFQMHKGDRLGVIGLNGAGKTTLLRTLSGVYKPSSGKLDIIGKTHSLIDVQLGMNVEATGIENVYLRGLQMGLSLKEVSEMLPGVLEFAGIGDAVNNVFLTYSTGMQLRLAIAISTMIAPEILIMDEWIGAGDEEFSQKLHQRMMTLIEGSFGLVIATHNAQLMKSLCSTGLVMHEGKSVFFGEITEALAYYDREILGIAPSQ